jgi:hypothetical protein
MKEAAMIKSRNSSSLRVRGLDIFLLRHLYLEFQERFHSLGTLPKEACHSFWVPCLRNKKVVIEHGATELSDEKQVVDIVRVVEAEDLV